MSKNQKKKLKICKNYARPCPLANNCGNCRYRKLQSKKEDGKSIIKLVGCKIGYDIDRPTESKGNCFHCSSEGTAQCKGN